MCTIGSRIGGLGRKGNSRMQLPTMLNLKWRLKSSRPRIRRQIQRSFCPNRTRLQGLKIFASRAPRSALTCISLIHIPTKEKPCSRQTLLYGLRETWVICHSTTVCSRTQVRTRSKLSSIFILSLSLHHQWPFRLELNPRLQIESLAFPCLFLNMLVRFSSSIYFTLVFVRFREIAI